jgi:prepilin-type N-terminal cleavage/methylation domain-containing protein
MTEAGFTLVELMIVVAIIGILAAIAIPNFQKYQAKARQKEAQLQLSGLYTAEMSVRGEHATFTGCVDQAGFRPDGDRRFYTVGMPAVEASSGACVSAAGAAVACDDANTVGQTAVVGTKCAPANGAAGAATDTAFGDPLPTAASPALVATSYSSFPGTQRVGEVAVADLGGSKLPGTAASLSQTLFQGSAIGSISSANNKIVDTWTINQDKVLLNTVNGL